MVGEQVPKTLAIRKAEPMTLWIAYPLHAFYLFCAYLGGRSWQLPGRIWYRALQDLKADKISGTGVLIVEG